MDYKSDFEFLNPIYKWIYLEKKTNLFIIILSDAFDNSIRCKAKVSLTYLCMRLCTYCGSLIGFEFTVSFLFYFDGAGGEER